MEKKGSNENERNRLRTGAKRTGPFERSRDEMISRGLFPKLSMTIVKVPMKVLSGSLLSIKKYMKKRKKEKYKMNLKLNLI